MNCREEALKIYDVCVSRAKTRQTVSCGELLSELGYGPGTPGYAIRSGLSLTWTACAHSNLPRLTAILTQRHTDQPAERFPFATWVEDKQEVFDYQKWPGADDIDWAYAWANRQMP